LELAIAGQEHFYLEGQIALAWPTEDGVHVMTSSQHPGDVQRLVARVLDLPDASVVAETRRMGGGFGGKESQGNALAVASAIAAHLTGRPCRMRYDRDDDFIITGKRHDLRIAYKAGFTAEGEIQHLEFTQYVRCGWALDLSLPVSDRAMLHADNAYYIPNIAITSHRLRTNTQSNTAFRGFGGPQGMVGIERVMDHIAHHLGRDPLEIRQQNLYGPAPRNITPYHMEVTDNIAPELITRLAETAEYQARRAEIEASNTQSPVIKRGIALTPVKFGISFTLTHLNQAGALVHIYADGSIHLNHGGTEMGQGLNTKVAQVAAEVFAQPLAAIKITATDTGKVPNTSATAASSGSDLNGMACKAACETIKHRLIEFAAEHWQQPAANIRFTPEGVEIGSETLSFKELIKTAYMHRVSLSSTGFYATPKINWDRIQGKGRPFFYFAYGAAVTEVAIDTLTGENRILRTDILHDCGTSLNPAIDIGQIEGGYVQGAGWLTMEELVWDAKGALKTHAPSTYKIPAASDRPGIFNVALWDGENREETIYRSKAVGEPPLMLGISALMALSHAIAQCGDGTRYPALEAPATPERILRAVDAQRGEIW
ncbi:MAG: xanthine dehydrogenase molybdopterin binding subunit, partial [Pseudomonadota bacterium]